MDPWARVPDPSAALRALLRPLVDAAGDQIAAVLFFGSQLVGSFLTPRESRRLSEEGAENPPPTPNAGTPSAP